jgi:hypothetical protein
VKAQTMATSTSESARAGPAPGPPGQGGVGDQVVEQRRVAPIEGASNFCPAMAVPMTVKMPEPITAPMPSAVSDHGPRDFFSECPALPSPG